MALHNKIFRRLYMKKTIKKTIGVLGSTLVATGEVGLILFSLSFLWSVGKFEFFTALIFVGIFTVIDKIKDGKKSEE